MWAISSAGVCPVLNESSVHCSSPVYEELAKYATTVLLITVFGMMPALLALAGLLLLPFDLWRVWRRRRAQPSASASTN